MQMKYCVIYFSEGKCCVIEKVKIKKLEGPSLHSLQLEVGIVLQLHSYDLFMLISIWATS